MARPMPRAANGGSSRRACAGTSPTRSARRRPKAAFQRSTISTPATTRAAVISSSTRSAAGAGRRLRVSEARVAAAQPAARDPLPGGQRAVRGRARGGRALAPRRRGARSLVPRRDHSRLGLDRLGADPAALGRRSRRTLARSRRCDRARQAGRGRESAGPSAAAADYKVHGVKTLNEIYRSPLGRIGMGLEYAVFRRGPLTMAPSQLGLFTRSDSRRARPNLQFHVQPLSLDKFGDPLHPFPAFTASVCNLQPTSRGFVRLRSADPGDDPRIQPNYLSTEEDRRVAADSIRVARRIISAPALRRFGPIEYLPGDAVPDDDAALAKAAGDIGTTIFHPVGTAKMGRDTDPNAVVDERLRVIGLAGLRVVDASVMPNITSGNTNSPTMMIAEKGADMIRQDQKR